MTRTQLTRGRGKVAVSGTVIGRRRLLGAAVAIPLAGAARLLADAIPPVVRISPWAAPVPAPTPAPDPIAGLGVLSPTGWRVIAQLVDAIFPRTGTSISGVEAGVLHYIHQALGGTPLHGHAAAPGRTRPGIYAPLLPHYRQVARRLEAMAQDAHHQPFIALSVTRRDALIARFARGAKADVGYHLGVAGGSGPMEDRALFEMVRRHAIEGYFADPVYGGNDDYRGWEAIGHTCQMNYPRPHRCDPARKQHP